MRVKIIILFYAAAAVFACACSQWKVNSLSRHELLFIENGAEAGSIALQFDEFALTDFSFGIGICNGKILTVDNVMRRIQILNGKGLPELVLGDLKNIDTRKVKSSPFRFGSIGCFTTDRDNNIYVQNRLLSAGKGNMDFSPSYIVVFDEKGRLQYTLGQKGQNSTPFYYIESLFVDDKNRLFVVSRAFDTWSVYRFNNKKQDFLANLGGLSFKEKDGSDVLEGQIDNVKVYGNGEMLLISVAYYNNRRFKYHKVYDYSVNRNKIDREIMTLPNPKNVLFSIVDEKNIYFWNMDRDDLKLMICNMEGHIMNNIHLDIGDSRSLYSNIISDSSGGIYSYQVSKKGISISEWN